MGLEVRISSLIDCNFVMWQLVTTGVDFITNFKGNEKAPELARGRIKAVYSHYTGIKADPLFQNQPFHPQFESHLPYTHPSFFFLRPR